MSFNSLFKFLCAAGLVCGSFSALSAGDAAKGPKRVGYFTEWGVYDKDYEIADVPAQHLSHLLYAFAVVDPSKNECIVYDPWAALQKVFPAKNGFAAQTWDQSANNQAGNFGRIKQLKAMYPNLKVLLSVGGWTKSGQFSVAASPESVEHFANSCVALMNQYGFDGLDFDWEYPVKGGIKGEVCTPPDHSPADKQNFTALLTSVKAKLKAGQELTIAAAARPDYLENLEVKKLSDGHIVDAIHIMAYDFHGSWNAFTAHHAPLFAADPAIDIVEKQADDLCQKQGPDKTDPATLCPQAPCPDFISAWNADASVQAYMAAGADPSILVMGAPFYGRAWMVSNPGQALNNGLYQTATKQTASQKDGNWEDGYFDYWKIQNMVKSGELQTYYDKVSHAPYAFSNKTGLFISYESVDSLKEKVEYVKSKQLGGIMFWSLDGDIHPATSASLLNTVSCEISPNDPACMKP